METIYQQLLASKADKVIAFMDSCFTGVTDGVSVYDGNTGGTKLAPKLFKPSEDGKLAVLTAGTEKQYSGAYNAKGHRMFSYFVIKELLEGNHGHIGDLGDAVTVEVRKMTKRLVGSGGRQDPVLQGNRSLSL